MIIKSVRLLWILMYNINGSKTKKDRREESYSTVGYLHYQWSSIVLFEGGCGCIFQSLGQQLNQVKREV